MIAQIDILKLAQELAIWDVFKLSINIKLEDLRKFLDTDDSTLGHHISFESFLRRHYQNQIDYYFEIITNQIL